MAKKTSYSFGRLLMQIALGVLLFIGGIWAFTGTGDFGCSAIVNNLGKVGSILKYVYGAIEIICGFLLILELFLGDRFGSFDNLLMWIVIIVWAIAIIFADIIGGFLKPDFVSWLWTLAGHVLVLGVMFNLKD